MGKRAPVYQWWVQGERENTSRYTHQMDKGGRAFWREGATGPKAGRTRVQHRVVSHLIGQHSW